MTQYEQVIKYIEIHGSIIPAKCHGEWEEGYFGSETSKRCRELRAKGVLQSVREGKFEKFWLKPRIEMPSPYKVRPIDTKQANLI